MNSCEGHEPRVAERITATLTRKRRPGFWRIGKKKAREIGHHLTDWSSEAVFLVALHLKPERFTTAEIDAGVGAFLIHASYHVASAAALYGFPVTDIVDVTMLPRNEPGKARGRKRERKPEAG